MSSGGGEEQCLLLLGPDKEGPLSPAQGIQNVSYLFTLIGSVHEVIVVKDVNPTMTEIFFQVDINC